MAEIIEFNYENLIIIARTTTVNYENLIATIEAIAFSQSWKFNYLTAVKILKFRILKSIIYTHVCRSGVILWLLCRFYNHKNSLSVSGGIPTNTSLNVYIRDYAKLRGTKAMCHEGGCGACIVAAEIKGETMAVNSCLVPILICDGYACNLINELVLKFHSSKKEIIYNKNLAWHMCHTRYLIFNIDLRSLT